MTRAYVRRNRRPDRPDGCPDNLDELVDAELEAMLTALPAGPVPAWLAQARMRHLDQVVLAKYGPAGQTELQLAIDAWDRAKPVPADTPG